MLRGLTMYGMAQAVGDLIEQGAPAFEAAVPVLSQLLKAEMAEREVRSIAYQIKAARFPAYKDLAGFDFAISEINEALVRQLHRCDFIDSADNAVLIGGGWHRQKSYSHRSWRTGCRAPSQKGALLRHRRSGQRIGAGKSGQQGQATR